MKTSILFFFFILNLGLYAQYGSIIVEVSENKDCLIENNTLVNPVSVTVNGKNLTIPVNYICDKNEKQDIPNLPQGVYKIHVKVPNSDTIMIENVRVSAEKTTFVSILIEPNCDLNCRQKRLRRKRYVNFD